MTTVLTPQQRRRNQIKLLILWLVPVGLMAIAGICYYLVFTGQLTIGSKNNGDLLVPPPKLQETFVNAPDPQLRDVWEGKWSIVLRVIGHCDERCKEALFLSRQLHIRLDKDADRVQRILLIEKSSYSDQLAETIAQEHSLLKVIPLGAGASGINQLDQTLQQNVAATKTMVEGEIPQLAFFLVDQAGYAMMTYHHGHEGNAILQDIKHLLRYSRKR